VSFVKQIPLEEDLDDDIDKPYSRILVFDEKGRPVKGEQSEYSKIVSRFYSNADNVNKDIWKIFFGDMSEEGDLIENDFYSVFMRIGELNSEGIRKSLSEVIKYIESELKKSIESFHSELDLIIHERTWEEEDFEKKITGCAEQAAVNACKTVEDAFISVETILTGISLFALEKDDFDTNAMIGQFAGRVDDLLAVQIMNINEYLDSSWQRYLDYIAVFEKTDEPDM
ncbi:MAG: hypothetical protein GX660_26825, partial [Clostridiaceae bacterium]|nr:hypothetical protein [Clostridiaceae bacterium]